MASVFIRLKLGGNPSGRQAAGTAVPPKQNTPKGGRRWCGSQVGRNPWLGQRKPVKALSLEPIRGKVGGWMGQEMAGIRAFNSIARDGQALRCESFLRILFQAVVSMVKRRTFFSFASVLAHVSLQLVPCVVQ